MPGRKRLRTAFPALEDTPERHREPRRDRPHRARSTGPHAIRAQAAHVKVAEKTSIIVGAVVAWVVTRYYANKARNIKALGWTPLGISRIVTRPVTDVAQGLALSWNGNPLHTPYTVMIRISNSGTQEVVGELTSPDR